MARSRSLPFVLFALAALLAGCGGGGSPHSGGAETGRVRDLSGVEIAGAVVKYYNESGTLLATGAVGSNGALPTPPSTATRFSIDASAFTDPTTSKTKYYSTYSYGRQYYDDAARCYPSLPQPGSTKGFTDDIFFFIVANSPPPPPVGCPLR